jgi:hypothetical protein
MTSSRIVALVLGAVLEFGAVVAIMLGLTPEPRAKVDYLVMGTLGTFVSLATVFAVVMLTKKATDSKREHDDLT